MLCIVDYVFYNRIRSSGFEVKNRENERLTVMGSRFPQICFFFFSVVLRNALRKRIETRVARAARLYALFRPVVSLYFDVALPKPLSLLKLPSDSTCAVSL